MHSSKSAKPCKFILQRIFKIILRRQGNLTVDKQKKMIPYGGWWLDEATYQHVMSEKHPFIEYERFAQFDAHQIRDEKGAFAVWHPSKLKLFYFTQQTSDAVDCKVLNISGSGMIIEMEYLVPISLSSRQIQDVVHHETQSLILFIFDKHILIWNYEKQEIPYEYGLEDNAEFTRGGFFPDDEKVWYLISTNNRGIDWGIWNYRIGTNEVNVLEDEFYGRNVVLHPSGKLFNAVWTEYQCGYYVYQSMPIEKQLFFYSKPTPRRSEYMAYSPVFSVDGRVIAFFTNPDLMLHKNHTMICMYEFESGNLIAGFYTGTNRGERYLQFVDNGRTLAFYVKDAPYLHIFNVKTGKKITTAIAPSKIRHFTGHELFGFYAVTHEEGLTVFFDSENLGVSISDSNQEIANRIATGFIESYRDCLVSQPSR